MPQQVNRANTLKHGYKLEIYMSTPQEIDALLVEDAVYIPTNDQNLMSLVMARKLRPNITAGRTFTLCWKTNSRGFGTDVYKMEFRVRSDLPCSVILGKLEPGVFLGAASELFDESFEFPKSRPNSVSSAVSRAVTLPASGSGPTTVENKTAEIPPWVEQPKLVNRTGTTSTWESDQTKVNTRPSSPQRLSPVTSSPSTFPPRTSILRKATHSATTAPAMKRDVEVQNDSHRPVNRNRQSVVESTARLGAVPCEVAEDSRGKITSSALQDPNFDTAVDRFPPLCESSTKHSDLQLEKESASAPKHYESGHLNSSTLQLLVVQQQNELGVDDIAGVDDSKNYASYAAECDHNISPNSARPSKSSRSQGSDISPLVSIDLNLTLDRKIMSTTEGRNSGLDIEGRSRKAQVDAPKDRSPRSKEREIDRPSPDPKDPKASGLESKTRAGPEPSIKSPGNSLHTTLPARQELPTGHGNITSYSVERFLQSNPNSAQEDHTAVEFAKRSASSTDERGSQSKKRSQKRGKAPRIRRAKPDVSDNIDLTPARGAKEYWTYDPGAKAYYHTDSDTQSRIWRSEEDSENSEA